MTIDNLTWVCFLGTQHIWYVFTLHIIGRLTAPIMWFFIAEGCHHTYDIRKNIARLFLFAVISHFAYGFAFGIPFMPLSTGVFNQTSVMWSLAWSALLIAMWRKNDAPNWAKIVFLIAVCLITFPSDWSTIAMICPF